MQQSLDLHNSLRHMGQVEPEGCRVLLWEMSSCIQIWDVLSGFQVNGVCTAKKFTPDLAAVTAPACSLISIMKNEESQIKPSCDNRVCHESKVGGDDNLTQTFNLDHSP